MSNKVLVVDDERAIADIIKFNLEKEGYQVETAYDGEEGLEKIKSFQPNLVVLDIMMPKKDGWSLLRKIKNIRDTPVIITTARGEEEDRIFGLELGAIDYMVKPISMKELILRAKLRIRKDTMEKQESYKFENMDISEEKRIVTENESEITLTPKEFDLLLFLCKNPEQVFKREQLLQKVWSYDFMGDTRTVDTHIKNLREKIEYCNKHIKTVWGVGYKLQIKSE